MTVKEKKVKQIAQQNILTTNEVCATLKVSRQYISMLVKKGRIEPFLISRGNHYFWWKPDIEEIVQTETRLFKHSK